MLLPTIILGIAAALAAAADSGAALADPTRPYAFQTAIEVPQDATEKSVQWRLNGIRIHEGERSAILNGQLVRAGDSLGGARVLEINPADVVLMQNSQKIVVKLVLSGVKKATPGAARESPAED